MRGDSTVWTLTSVGLLIPLVTHAAGLSFLLRDIDGGPYHFIPPLWFLAWQPVVFIGLATGEKTFLSVGAVLNALGGLALVISNLVQLPLALIVPSDGLEEVPRLVIAAMHVAAIATGALWLGVAARIAARLSSAPRRIP